MTFAVLAQALGLALPVNPLFIILALASLVPWAVIVTRHVFDAEDRGRRLLFPALLWAVALVAILVSVVSSGSGQGAAEGTPERVVLGSMQRALLGSAFALVASLSVVAIFYVLNRRFTDRPPADGLWLGFIAFTSASLVSAVFGTKPALLPGLLLTPLLFAAVYLLPPVNPGLVLVHARRVLLGVVYLSAGVALLAPDLAFSVESRLQFLGMDERLQGVMGHPNGLGAVTALALVLTFAWASSGWGRRTHLSVCLLVLVLTDSRAAWASAVLGVLVVWLASVSTVEPLVRAGRRCVIIVCIGAAGFLALSGPSDGPTTPAARVTTGIGSVNGRTTVWKLSLDEWKKSPVVGYGPLLWSDDYRRERYGQRLDWAGQAHNQYVQSLGAAGALGLLTLVMYLALLLRSAIRTRANHGGIGLALLVTLLVQMLNETPLRNHFVDSSLLAHLIVFSLLLALTRADRLDPVVSDRTPCAVGTVGRPVCAALHP